MQYKIEEKLVNFNHFFYPHQNCQISPIFWWKNLVKISLSNPIQRIPSANYHICKPQYTCIKTNRIFCFLSVHPNSKEILLYFYR